MSGPWRRISAEGADWEVRAVASEPDTRRAEDGADEVLEFRCLAGDRPPRRIRGGGGELEAMSEEDLLAAFRRSRPIGADHYGRPGKRMTDASD